MNELEGLKKKLSKTNELLDKLDEMLAQGEITEGKYKQLSAKYSDEVENLKNQIAEGVIKQDFGIKTEEEEREDRVREEQERLRRQREEEEHDRVQKTEDELEALKKKREELKSETEKLEKKKQIEEQEARRKRGIEEREKLRKQIQEDEERLRKMQKEGGRKENLKDIWESSIGMKFTLIPAGEFMMGSDEFDWTKPVHRVKINKPFYLGIYPVTQREWKELMRINHSHFKGENLPVETVSWNDVQEFIKKLNEKEGTNKYRLPSEAEWEYAARAGTTTRYSFGDDASKLGEYAWYNENSGSRQPDFRGCFKDDFIENKWNGKTHPVGEKVTNPWGLYDIYGNVNELVQDIYHDSYNGAPTDGSVWGGDGPHTVYRGGCWKDHASSCQSTDRYEGLAACPYYNLGFRLLRDL